MDAALEMVLEAAPKAEGAAEVFVLLEGSSERSFECEAEVESGTGEPKVGDGEP